VILWITLYLWNSSWYTLKLITAITIIKYSSLIYIISFLRLLFRWWQLIIFIKSFIIDWKWIFISALIYFSIWKFIGFSALFIFWRNLLNNTRTIKLLLILFYFNLLEIIIKIIFLIIIIYLIIIIIYLIFINIYNILEILIICKISYWICAYILYHYIIL